MVGHGRLLMVRTLGFNLETTGSGLPVAGMCGNLEQVTEGVV